jgi:hypothetical protein
MYFQNGQALNCLHHSLLMVLVMAWVKSTFTNSVDRMDPTMMALVTLVLNLAKINAYVIYNKIQLGKDIS